MDNFISWKNNLFSGIDKSWLPFFESIKNKEYFLNMLKNVYVEYKTKKCFPEVENIFKIFKLTKVSDIKVVILGQDPYHNEEQADGIAFSIKGDKITPSLRNLFKELKNDTGIERTKLSLDDWVVQGIFLMNTVWTVEKHKPNSHCKIGWLLFTDDVISFLKQNIKIIFVLLGQSAKNYKYKLNNAKILESSHPSPFSYKKGFEGSKIYTKINDYLGIINIKKIVWDF